jgi:hypothetical protein
MANIETVARWGSELGMQEDAYRVPFYRHGRVAMLASEVDIQAGRTHSSDDLTTDDPAADTDPLGTRSH